jgi:hypothetical protein
MYEVDTLVYATAELGQKPEKRSGRENALLESFAVHARCLNDFLWHDRNDRLQRDAFAADFCAPGDWERVREDLSQAALSEIRSGRRFGREIMHLTYDRIDGEGKDKEWPCGRVLIEIAGALKEFASMSLAGRLDEQTRGRLLDLKDALDPPPDAEPLKDAIRHISVATGLPPEHFRHVTGGSINLSDVKAGGSWLQPL